MHSGKNTIIYLLGIALTILLGLPAVAFSSVTMMGNRIIYPADSSSVNVEFTNKDIFPYAVQTWIAEADANSTPVTAKAPFIASPALFKIAPDSGQVLRITFTGGKNLPQDRESIFYFNFLQIPPINAGGAESQNKNKMLVMLKNRVKLFYRPVSIANRINHLGEDIKITSSMYSGGTKLLMKNGSPFYVSIASVKIKQEDHVYSQPADMLVPFSQGHVDFKNLKLKQNAIAVIEYINDQGARVNHEYQINP
ncbi:fimbria/pilus periplasmic chaperone [Rahnella inusitata]|uniref:Molecular chaperone n=1 Tax=Rahnella inusitata TaxID=58169 RepID=A0ABX9P9G8_9GAMM|nr:fimbria/pilus periplasmic chaperone [Rahnella inusitata]RJT16365.1 hypothetical protein D5396_04475 [Rahnella inusitata]